MGIIKGTADANPNIGNRRRKARDQALLLILCDLSIEATAARNADPGVCATFETACQEQQLEAHSMVSLNCGIMQHGGSSMQGNPGACAAVGTYLAALV